MRNQKLIKEMGYGINITQIPVDINSHTYKFTATAPEMVSGPFLEIHSRKSRIIPGIFEVFRIFGTYRLR